MTHTLSSLAKRIEALEASIANKPPVGTHTLDDHNFHIDSTGWKSGEKDGIRFLVNPSGDVWEYINNNYTELNGEQLFTWEAAMRETKKAGKRIPTDEEFSILLKTKVDMPHPLFAGYRYTDGSFGSLGTSAYFWSSVQSGTDAWYRALRSGYATVGRNAAAKAGGFSVRCLKD